MKLDNHLLKNERMIIIDWDNASYIVYYHNGAVVQFGIRNDWNWMTLSDEFLDWLPER